MQKVRPYGFSKQKTPAALPLGKIVVLRGRRSSQLDAGQRTLSRAAQEFETARMMDGYGYNEWRK